MKGACKFRRRHKKINLHQKKFASKRKLIVVTNREREGRTGERKEGRKEERKGERKEARKEGRKEGRREERKKGSKEERKKGRKEGRKERNEERKERKEERKEERKQRRNDKGRKVNIASHMRRGIVSLLWGGRCALPPIPPPASFLFLQVCLFSF